MELNSLNVHDQNADVADAVVVAAEQQGMDVRHNASSFSGFAGAHRYVLLARNVSNDYSIRSRACIAYTETPYSRRYKPSIIGERRALQQLLSILTARSK